MPPLFCSGAQLICNVGAALWYHKATRVILYLWCAKSCADTQLPATQGSRGRSGTGQTANPQEDTWNQCSHPCDQLSALQTKNVQILKYSRAMVCAQSEPRQQCHSCACSLQSRWRQRRKTPWLARHRRSIYVHRTQPDVSSAAGLLYDSAASALLEWEVASQGCKILHLANRRNWFALPARLSLATGPLDRS